jgi:hypothetical protein
VFIVLCCNRRFIRGIREGRGTGIEVWMVESGFGLIDGNGRLGLTEVFTSGSVAQYWG